MSATESTSTFYVTGGTLRHDAPSYVERQADKDLLDGLLRGEFCYVLTSRQMGKSSLMVRTAAKLRDQGINVVVLDLTAIGQNLTPEQWYDGLLVRMGRQLDLEDELEDFWKANSPLGPCQRFFAVLRDVVLPRESAISNQCSVSSVEAASKTDLLNTALLNTGRLVIFVDELDVVRSLPFSTDEFFAALRECYNRRTEDAEFNRLTFCLLGVASPSELISNPKLTPFNIGRRIELKDFTPEEAVPLAMGLQASGGASERMSDEACALLERILHWTHGHPYLTQRLCQAVAGQPTARRLGAVDDICQELFLSRRAREEDDNLLFVRERILRTNGDLPALLHLYEQVQRGKTPPDDKTNPLVTNLHLSGVVRSEHGSLRVRNRIYQQVFDRPWILTSMPDAEVRRQRAAFRRGVFRATGIAMMVVAAMAGLFLYARSQTRTAQRNLYVADMNLAAQAWEAGNLLRTRELLGKHLQADRPDLRGFEWRLLWGLAHEDHSKFSFSTGTNRISCVALSPEGKHLAWGSTHGAPRIIDLVAQRELVALGGHAGGISSLAFSADGRSLASGGGDGTLRLWESGSWREVRGFTGHSNAVGYVAFHPNGTKLISSGDDALRVWELGVGGNVEVLPRPAGRNTISADGTLLASYGGLNNTVRFRKLGGRNEPLPSLPPQKAIIISVAFFPDGKSVVVSVGDSSVTRWDLASMKPMQTYRQKAVVRELALSGNGKTLATASTDNLIKLWDAESGQELRTLRGHTNAPTRLALSADGGTLVSASADNTIKVWDSRVGHETNVLQHQGYLLNVAVSRDGKVLATSDPNFHTISLWEVPSQRLVFSDTDPEQKARAQVALSPDGQWLAVGWFFNRRVLELWDVSTKPYRKGATLAVEFPLGSNLKFSPDGSVLSVRGTNGVINLWDVAGQKVFGALANHVGECATAFTADSKIIATSSDREIRLWDVKSQQRLGAFNSPRGSVWTLSFSPDGRLLAAGGQADRDVNVWDVTDRAHPRLLPPLVGHTAGVRAVAFSPDGRTLASGSFDSTVKLWSVALWQEIATLREHSSEVSCLVFSSDGNTLFTGSGDATVRIWHAPSFAEIEPSAKAQGLPK